MRVCGYLARMSVSACRSRAEAADADVLINTVYTCDCGGGGGWLHDRVTQQRIRPDRPLNCSI